MSFLRRQVMDYKEQMKQANENNAFMIHNASGPWSFQRRRRGWRWIRKRHP